MHYFLFVTVLSLHVGHSLRSSDFFSEKHGSHNLLKLENSNNSVQRSARCTPCERDIKRPVSNHLEPEYRGNGADNLGYDWSPMAWGGPAFPRRSKAHMGGMRGRDGRMMPQDGRGPGNVQVVCDTCRSYWDGAGGGGRDGGDGRGRGGDRGRQFDMGGGSSFYGGGQPGYYQGPRMRPEDFETRVMSPTVGVLVKPGSRIAYIPSRSGEMYWDGVSGGGTRWDGFSNGISWIGNAPAEWDRSDSEPRDIATPLKPGDYPFGGSGFDPLNDKNRRPSWDDNSGRGYYFTNGVPNGIDPQWRDRGYASNWHYGSTNQNGWNGNNMKWNYGGKQWADNDRAANRFYFNSPQDRTYGPNDGHRQYGNQYPNYQSSPGYPAGFRPQPWPGGGSYRPNDRFPANFQQGGSGSGDKDKPWDYTSRDPFGTRRPGPQPEWARPGPSYPAPASFGSNYGKFPGPNEGYNKFSPSDKNNFEKPWNGPFGYGPSKPDGGDGFPYGGNRYPEEETGGGGRPSYPGGHLFYPNDGNRQPGYGVIEPGSGENRPSYPNANRKPEYSGYGNQVGSFSGDGGRPLTEYPGDKRPFVIYTGGRPSGGYPGGGSSSGSYPGGSSSSGSYPGGGSSSGSYPGGGSSSGSYPGGGSSSGSYPGGSGSSTGYPSGHPGGGSPSAGYPSGGNPSGGYPSSGSASGGYPVSGTPVGGYPNGGSSGAYPGASRPSGYPGSSGGSVYPSGVSRPGGYPAGGNYPVGGGRPDNYHGGGDPSEGRPGGSGSAYPRPGSYPSGGSGYPGGSSTSGFTPQEGYSNSGYFGGSRPTGYPNAERPGGYRGQSNRPDEYLSGNRPSYPVRGPSYLGPGGVSEPTWNRQGTKTSPKGYYTGFITELSANDGQSQYGGKNPNYFGSSYPGDKNYYSGKDRDRYFNGGSYSNGYPPPDKNRYPVYSEDRYPSSGDRGGSYPTGDNDRGRDKYYYGQSDGKGKYPSNGYPSNHRYPSGGGDDFDRNQGSSNDKNSWNYGQNEHKEGIYRRSGGSYPPYRGGQYFTSSYLASMSTTAGSTQAGSEQKTQSVTKVDEVTQPTLDSS